MTKKDFINSEIRMLTFGAAFQRAGVYVPNAPEKKKAWMRNKMHSYMKGMLSQYEDKKKIVSDTVHIENLLSLQDFSSNFKELFINGKLPLGVIQKMFNLFLKYHWCLGNIGTPPHFPIDRIMQQNLYIKPLIAWTQMKEIDEYMRIINHARDCMQDPEFMGVTKAGSLAELELKLFERRN
jgi:hypothetical protein